MKTIIFIAVILGFCIGFYFLQRFIAKTFFEADKAEQEQDENIYPNHKTPKPL